ncbi:UNVERIFIED_CONTAM: hypothetical protein FKN15_007799 [Acipenser sinensis]
MTPLHPPLCSALSLRTHLHVCVEVGGCLAGPRYFSPAMLAPHLEVPQRHLALNALEVVEDSGMRRHGDH